MLDMASLHGLTPRQKTNGAKRLAAVAWPLALGSAVSIENR
jgi:hypothetical protein